MSLVHEFREAGMEVEHFGQQHRPVEDKVGLCQGFEYNLCPENSYSPGYVTEKLIQSYVAGCKSIYFGCLEGQPFKDHSMIIEVKQTESLPVAIERVRKSGHFATHRGDDCVSYPRLADERSIREVMENVVSFLREKTQHLFLDSCW